MDLFFAARLVVTGVWPTYWSEGPHGFGARGRFFATTDYPPRAAAEFGWVAPFWCGVRTTVGALRERAWTQSSSSG